MRLSALLFPVGVALFPIGVLLWYGMVHIPAQEAYLNARNLRLLTTLSAAIQAKIESFDSALDHAVESFDPSDDKVSDKGRQQALTDGVHLFARDLDILKVDSGPRNAKAGATHTVATSPDIESQLLEEAADPPRVAVAHDEGRYYLYLGAEPQAHGRPIRVVARSDLQTVVGPLLVDTTQEFAAVLLATATGEVIAQNAPLGLSLAQLGGVLNSTRPASPGKDAAPPLKFSDLTTYSNVVPVAIGEVDYKLYMQPVALSLLSQTGADKGARDPEQWVLCALVRADRFKADSSALTYQTVLWFSGFLGLLILALPFVKLRALRARERLRASDVRWANAAAFLLIALLTFTVLAVLAFWDRFEGAIDRRLTKVATALAAKVDQEVEAIDDQAAAFNAGTFPGGGPIEPVLTRVSPKLSDRSPSIKVLTADTVRCDPPEGCQTDLVNAQWFNAARLDRVGAAGYPFFDQVTWAGDDGWQRVRYTPGKALRPFMNIFGERLAYGDKARAAWDAPQSAPTKGIDVESSPNTGEPLTIFWRTGDEHNVRWVQSMAISNLVSLDQPLLPKGVSFAVVDRDGLVLFHSVSSRRLRENFLKEAEDNAAVRGLIQNRQPGHVSGTYQGRSARFFVQPLRLSRFQGDQDPGWSLIVAQDFAVVDTVNLETLTIACWLFAGCLLILAIMAFLIYSCESQPPRKWFWPDPQKRNAYRAVVLLNTIAIAVFSALFIVSAARGWPNAVLLVATAIIALVSAVSTFRIVTRARPQAEEAGPIRFRHPFFFARATSLVVIAGLPAIASFQIAYAFEATLLARCESAHESSDKPAADALSLNVFQTLRLDDSVARDFIARRRAFVSTESAVALWDPPSGSSAVGPLALDGLLAWMHRRYNDIANDMEAAAGLETRQIPAPPLGTAWFLTLVVALCVACYGLVYWFVRPMFMLDAAGPRALASRKAEHLLLVGPPGSGKSTRFAATPEIRVFDVATQAWGERRKSAIPVPIERRRFVAAAAVSGAASAPGEWFKADAVEPSASIRQAGGGWADAFDYSRLPLAVAIDHVDYRLDEPEFAAQTLKFVEHAVYRDGSRVSIAADRDPLTCLRENHGTPADLDRWIRVLRVFKRECVGIDAQSAAVSESDLPYFEALWNACSVDERLALAQLAEEGVVNPQKRSVVRDLLQSGLIVRNPTLQIVSDRFKDFVSQATNPGQVAIWERQGVAIPWGSIEVAMLTIVATLAGLLIVTQEQLVSAWIGFIPAFLPTAQKLVKAVAALRSPATDGVTA